MERRHLEVELPVVGPCRLEFDGCTGGGSKFFPGGGRPVVACNACMEQMLTDRVEFQEAEDS